MRFDTSRPEYLSARAAVAKVASFVPESIAREEDLGKALNFSAAVPFVSELVELHKLLDREELAALSSTQIRKIEELAKRAFQHFTNMLGYNAAASNAPQLRKQYLDVIPGEREYFLKELVDVLPFILCISGDFAKLISRSDAEITQLRNQVSERLSEATKSIEHELEDVRKLRSDLDGILDAARRTAQEYVVQDGIEIFRKEAEDHERSGRRWLTACIVVLLLAFGFTALVPPAPATTDRTLSIVDQLLSGRLSSTFAVYATFGFALFLCGRSFHAHRHNVVINRHRSNVLSSFHLLLRSSEGETRSLILTRVVDALYAPQGTGYVRPSTDDSRTMAFLNVPPNSPKLTNVSE